MMVSVSRILIFSISFLFCFLPLDAFDPLDPQGNITVKWDILEWRDDQNGYTAQVTINNYQLYRHIENPGWRLSWQWPKDEVIWAIQGAEATERGNCSRFRGNLPHCCDKKPVIIDLLPGTSYNRQTKNCCRGGVLSSMTQNPSKSVASFQLSVGDFSSGHDNESSTALLSNFDIGVHGYSCGPARKSNPTKFPVDGGRRQEEALMTIVIECSFSPILASSSPSCCVALSSFYNDTIVQCPRCSCGCQSSLLPSDCVSNGEESSSTSVLQFPNSARSTVSCTEHMCPIRIHWHVKVSYRDYWRVKMTITNFNLIKNYSEWNLVVQHPNLEYLTQVFSFNYEPLDIYPGFRQIDCPSGNRNRLLMFKCFAIDADESGVFWGIPYYNDMLLQYGKNGNVQSEMLLNKDPNQFTFDAGWAFPRRIYFNGEPCVMPSPDLYPRLPNSSSGTSSVRPTFLSLLPWLSVIVLFLGLQLF